MSDTSTSNVPTSPLLGSVIGYITGAINTSHFQQALDAAEKLQIPEAIKGATTAGNIVAAKFAFVAILQGALTSGTNGASNAAFTSAFAALAGTIAGPAAGLAAGATYGQFLDFVSAKVHEYDVGGEVYDLVQIVQDPEFQELVEQNAYDLFLPLLDSLADIGHFLLDFLIKPAYGDDINPLENDLYKAARVYRVPVRRDPLTLDLDGDGLETTPFNAANPVFFDHDLNGIKEGTGWVGADDGFLVYDRNGNNVIDNGSELFGDHTPKSGGGYTADGFAALAQEDTNQDGKVDTNDAHFANLRVWRDLNQNGLSESNELFTLAQLGITGINVGKAVSCNL